MFTLSLKYIYVSFTKDPGNPLRYKYNMRGVFFNEPIQISRHSIFPSGVLYYANTAPKKRNNYSIYYTKVFDDIVALMLYLSALFLFKDPQIDTEATTHVKTNRYTIYATTG